MSSTGVAIEDLNQVTKTIIGCAIEVHTQLGPGLLENTYEQALAIEFEQAGMYKGRRVGEHRLDLLVEDAIVVEIKSVERLDPVFEAQVLTYLRITGKRLGLLINFNSRLVTRGIKRFVL